MEQEINHHGWERNRTYWIYSTDVTMKLHLGAKGEGGVYI